MRLCGSTERVEGTARLNARGLAHWVNLNHMVEPAHGGQGATEFSEKCFQVWAKSHQGSADWKGITEERNKA